MTLKKYLFLVFVAFSVLGFSQEPIELSPLSKISILTVGTADELSSKFGHTAIRIQDSTTNMDIVFGYGGFDFNAPFFYWKFTTGKLDYSITGNRFPSFLESYKIENRWVREQVLNLSQPERNTLFKFLQNNYRKENRNYKYDFLFDNCATKIPEVLQNGLGDKLKFNYTHIENPFTFRQLIHQHLDENDWTTFGIDLALGSVIDKKATPLEHMFLPIYINKQLPNTTINGKSFMTDESLLLDVKPIDKSSDFLLSPLFWLSLLLILVIIITYSDFKKNTRSKWLDFTLFFLTGAAGLLIFFLWFLTDHSATAGNFNILWAFPLNIVLAFVLVRKKPLPKWISKYLWIVLLGIVLTLILWLFKVQIFSQLIIFILLALAIRYVFLLKKNTSKNN